MNSKWGSFRFLTSVRTLRKLPGSSRSVLSVCSDGNRYVVKPSWNPRLALNEAWGHLIMAELKLPQPEVRVVYAGTQESAPPEESDLVSRGRAGADFHFGSRVPVGTIYDFLPRCVLQTQPGLEVFWGWLVVDKWMGQVDSRQCIFTRSKDGAFQPMAIDNGDMLGGRNWNYHPSSSSGLYFDCCVYDRLQSLRDLEVWLSAVEGLSLDRVYAQLRQLYPMWLDQDQDLLSARIDELWLGRKSLEAKLQRSLDAAPNHFRSWVG